MKILHVTWTLGFGGAEEMIVDLANQHCQVARVWIVVVNDIVEPNVRARIDPRVVVIELARSPGSRSIRPFLSLNWLTYRIRPDVVHLHTWTLIKVLPFCRQTLALTIHTTRDKDPFDARVASRCDTLFAISEAVSLQVQEQMSQLQPLKRTRPKVIVNGVQSAEIRLGAERSPNKFRIVQVARLEHECKGQDVLLRALARLRDLGSIEGLTLDFIGNGTSRQILEKLTADLGLGRFVRFRGAVARRALYEELSAYDLLVQASHYEGFGLAVVEAMMAGVTVLVSDLAASRDIIQGGRFGFLFGSGDEIACSEAINQIREMRTRQPETLSRLTHAARQHALEQFDMKRTANEYWREYGDMIGAGQRKRRKALLDLRTHLL